MIEWRDHFSTDGFFDLTLEELEDEVILNSLGFFMKEDKNYYHFARTLGTDTCADLMSILKKQIITLKEIN